MTHDELIVKLAEPAHTLNANDARNVYLLALRAVVELHKPTNFILKDDEVIEQWCTADSGRLVHYPCETIRAIEKELG